MLSSSEFNILWRSSRVRPGALWWCVPVHRERDRDLSGCLWGFVSRRLVALASIASGSIISWTASVEPACWHPAAFLTTSTFYSSDSGPLWDRDLAVFSFVGCPVYLLALRAPLSRNPASPTQRAPSGLPELVIQLEQQGSSLALTHVLVMTAK